MRLRIKRKADGSYVASCPGWNLIFSSPWQAPGKYKAANKPKQGEQTLAPRNRRCIFTHEDYQTQVVGQRADGKYFYLNVHADGKDAQSRSSRFRAKRVADKIKELVRTFTNDNHGSIG